MSGARSLARSPKLADGITSETTEESGVNGCMSALPFGSGSGRRRFFSEPTDANEPCGIGQLKPGRRTAAIFLFGELQPWFHYPDPMPGRNHATDTVKSFLTRCG